MKRALSVLIFIAMTSPHTLQSAENGSLTSSSEAIQLMPKVASMLPQQIPPIMVFNPKTDKLESRFSDFIQQPSADFSIDPKSKNKSSDTRRIAIVNEMPTVAKNQKKYITGLNQFIEDKTNELGKLFKAKNIQQTPCTTPYMIRAKTSHDPKHRLAYFSSEIAELKKQIFNNRLEGFDYKVQMFHDGKMSLISFVDILTNMKDMTFGPKNQYPEIEQYIVAHNLETKINFSEVERERSQILRRLIYRFDHNQKSELRSKILAFRIGNLSDIAFYDYLKTSCQNTGIKIETYRSLGAYLNYLSLTSKLDHQKLFSEIKWLENQRYSGLIVKPIERVLVQQTATARSIAKLINLSAASTEWAQK